VSASPIPTVQPGRKAVVKTQPNVTLPARYKTLLMSPPGLSLCAYKCWAMSGLIIPNSLPQKLAIPQAVPRMGAGNASGVHPYKTALNIDWKKYGHAHHRGRDDHRPFTAKLWGTTEQGSQEDTHNAGKVDVDVRAISKS
jgi:hypothetical protein